MNIANVKEESNWQVRVEEFINLLLITNKGILTARVPILGYINVIETSFETLRKS